jgi:hypothetical protein
MHTTAAPADHAVVPAPLPSPATRTVVTFLLIVHLFALAVAMASNDGGSQLASRLRPLVRPYLQLLAMDLSYRFALINGSEADLDYSFVTDLTLPDGSTKTVVVPDPALGSGQRFRRYSQLGRRTAVDAAQAELTGDDSGVGIVPSAVGGWVLRSNNATSGTITCRGEVLRDMPGVAENRPAEFREPYAADIKLSGNQVILNKRSGQSESAPAATTP